MATNFFSVYQRSLSKTHFTLLVLYNDETTEHISMSFFVMNFVVHMEISFSEVPTFVLS